MKKLKIIRSAVIMVMCILAIVTCLNAAKGFQEGFDSANPNYVRMDSVEVKDGFSITDYSYYGGDAYTGIQQAAADTSNNVVLTALTLIDAADMLYDAQKVTAYNVAELAGSLNATASQIGTIGSMLSTALAFAFAIPGIKSLFELIQGILEIKEEKAANAARQEAPAESEKESVCEEVREETPAEETEEAGTEEAAAEENPAEEAPQEETLEA